MFFVIKLPLLVFTNIYLQWLVSPVTAKGLSSAQKNQLVKFGETTIESIVTIGVCGGIEKILSLNLKEFTKLGYECYALVIEKKGELFFDFSVFKKYDLRILV